MNSIRSLGVLLAVVAFPGCSGSGEVTTSSSSSSSTAASVSVSATSEAPPSSASSTSSATTRDSPEAKAATTLFGVAKPDIAPGVTVQAFKVLVLDSAAKDWAKPFGYAERRYEAAGGALNGTMLLNESRKCWIGKGLPAAAGGTLYDFRCGATYLAGLTLK